MSKVDRYIEAVENDANSIGRFRAKVKHQILGFLEEARASSNPAYYLSHLARASSMTWEMVSGAKLVGTKQQYKQVADNLVDFWCKPITLEYLMANATILQKLREKRMAQLLGKTHQQRTKGRSRYKGVPKRIYL